MSGVVSDNLKLWLYWQRFWCGSISRSDKRLSKSDKLAVFQGAPVRAWRVACPPLESAMKVSSRGKSNVLGDGFHAFVARPQIADRNVAAKGVLDRLKGRAVSLKPTDQSTRG